MFDIKELLEYATRPPTEQQKAWQKSKSRIRLAVFFAVLFGLIYALNTKSDATYYGITGALLGFCAVIGVLVGSTVIALLTGLLYEKLVPRPRG